MHLLSFLSRGSYISFIQVLFGRKRYNIRTFSKSTVYVNIVSEYGLSQAQIGYLMVVTSIGEFISRYLWGVLTRVGVSVPVCGIIWTVIACFYAFLMAFSSTFLAFIAYNVLAGIWLGGFAGQIHAYVVDFVGLELQPDFMIFQK